MDDNNKAVKSLREELASIHNTDDKTPRDWLDNLNHTEGWTSLSCPKCSLGFRGWKFKPQCALCAIPVWPADEVHHIRGVAIEFNDVVWMLPAPNRHPDVIRMIINKLGSGLNGPDIQGFYTNRGRFLNRGEALAVAILAKQLISRIEDIRGGLLYSEDLW